MTDPGRGVAIHENCNIFVTDRRMIDQKQMAAFLELYGQIAGRAPLLIVAEDIAEGALQVLGRQLSSRASLQKSATNRAYMPSPLPWLRRH